MDSVNLADRLAARRPAGPADEADALDDCGAYACARGPGRVLMIDFRLGDGGRVAFPYATLERVAYDPSEGMKLTFLGVTVHLGGRNLATSPAGGLSLLDAIHRHRVPWVRETEEWHGAFRPADATVVSKIKIAEAE